MDDEESSDSDGDVYPLSPLLTPQNDHEVLNTSDSWHCVPRSCHFVRRSLSHPYDKECTTIGHMTLEYEHDKSNVPSEGNTNTVVHQEDSEVVYEVPSLQSVAAGHNLQPGTVLDGNKDDNCLQQENFEVVYEVPSLQSVAAGHNFQPGTVLDGIKDDNCLQQDNSEVVYEAPSQQSVAATHNLQPGTVLDGTKESCTGCRRPNIEMVPIPEESQSPTTVVCNQWPPPYTCGPQLVLKIFLAVLGICIHFGDLVMDCMLMREYLTEGQIEWFLFTLAFTVGPMALTSIISLMWYIMEKNKYQDRNEAVKTRTCCVWITSSLLGLGKVARLVWVIANIFRNLCEKADDRRRRLCKNVRRDSRDAAMIGVFEAFLEALPQLLLQTCLYLSNEELELNSTRGLLIGLSCLGCAFSKCAYYKAHVDAIPDKPGVSLLGFLCCLAWRLSELAPRFLVIACFIVSFEWWILLPTFIHLTIVVAYMYWVKPELPGLCGRSIVGKCLFYILTGYISMFCFVNLQEGKTIKRMTVFYIIFHLENIIMERLVMYSFVDIPGNVLYNGGMKAYIMVYVLPGVLFGGAVMMHMSQLIYYCLLHISRKSRNNH